MALTTQQLNFISRWQQALAATDDAMQQFAGLFANVNRLCALNPDGTPATNEDGTFQMLVSDEDVQAAFGFNAQELAMAVFGTAAVISSIPGDLGLQIGKVRA